MYPLKGYYKIILRCYNKIEEHNDSGCIQVLCSIFNNTRNKYETDDNSNCNKSNNNNTILNMYITEQYNNIKTTNKQILYSSNCEFILICLGIKCFWNSYSIKGILFCLIFFGIILILICVSVNYSNEIDNVYNGINPYGSIQNETV